MCVGNSISPYLDLIRPDIQESPNFSSSKTPSFPNCGGDQGLTVGISRFCLGGRLLQSFAPATFQQPFIMIDFT